MTSRGSGEVHRETRKSREQCWANEIHTSQTKRFYLIIFFLGILPICTADIILESCLCCYSQICRCCCYFSYSVFMFVKSND